MQQVRSIIFCLSLFTAFISSQESVLNKNISNQQGYLAVLDRYGFFGLEPEQDSVLDADRWRGSVGVDKWKLRAPLFLQEPEHLRGGNQWIIEESNISDDFTTVVVARYFCAIKNTWYRFRNLRLKFPIKLSHNRKAVEMHWQQDDGARVEAAVNLLNPSEFRHLGDGRFTSAPDALQGIKMGCRLNVYPVQENKPHNDNAEIVNATHLTFMERYATIGKIIGISTATACITALAISYYNHKKQPERRVSIAKYSAATWLLTALMATGWYYGGDMVSYCFPQV